MKNVNVLKNVIGTEPAGRVARRLQMLIVLFTSGESFALVGFRTHWDKRTVAMWYSRFALCPKSVSGIRAALSDLPRSGRPPKINRELLKEAQAWCEGRAFTPVELCGKLEELSGVRLSMSQVRRYAKRWGYSRKKSQPIAVNRATMSAVYGWRHRLLALVSKYKEQGYTIVTEDESHFKDATRTAKYWVKRYLRVFLQWSGDHHRFSMFCSVTMNGETFFTDAKVIDTQSFLEHIDKVYQKVGKMVLILDKASWHTSVDATAYFKERDIILVWYPTGHPYLNPVEEIWNIIKAKMDHSIRYADIDTHLEAFFAFVNSGHVPDCDFLKFWKRSPPKGITRPIIRRERDLAAPIVAQKANHKPKSGKC